VYAVLLGLYILGFVSGIPFIFSVQGSPSLQGFLWESLQGFLLGFAILPLGLLLSTSTGLGAPYIEKRLCKKPEKASMSLVISLSVVVVISASFLLILLRLIISVFAVVYLPDVSDVVAASTDFINNYPEGWKWFLVSFHAGVTEEIIFRFGLMNLLVWLGNRLLFVEKKSQHALVLWTANLIAALVFGALHLVGVLPVPDILFTQVSVVVQNALVGLVFGWFYWRYGLESAMLTHFLLDVFFYVVMIPILTTANFVLILLWLAITVITLIIFINKYIQGKSKCLLLE
jgi:membrane protease YdiL (CAAX protease family)